VASVPGSARPPIMRDFLGRGGAADGRAIGAVEQPGWVVHAAQDSVLFGEVSGRRMWDLTARRPFVESLTLRCSSPGKHRDRLLSRPFLRTWDLERREAILSRRTALQIRTLVAWRENYRKLVRTEQDARPRTPDLYLNSPPDLCH